MEDSTINGFTSAIALAKSAISLAGSGIGLITDNTKREAARTALEQAQKAFEIAELQAAESLGHPLCHCDWPSAICIRNRSGRWECRRCQRMLPAPSPGFGSY